MSRLYRIGSDSSDKAGGTGGYGGVCRGVCSGLSPGEEEDVEGVWVRVDWRWSRRGRRVRRKAVGEDAMPGRGWGGGF